MRKGILVVMVGGLVALLACVTQEPKNICNVGRGQPYAIVATLKPTQTGTCADPAAQAAVLNDNGNGFNLFGMEAYYSLSDNNEKLVAIRPGQYEGLPVPGTQDAGVSAPNPNGLGSWTDFFPDSSDFCTVSTFSAATDGTSSYVVSNLKALVQPTHAGTQIQFDMTYNDGSGCTADYTVIGTWPEVQCVQDSDCSPAPNIDAGNPFGSGLACDYHTKCVGLQAPVTLPDGGTSQVLGLCQLDTSSGSFPYVGSNLCPAQSNQ